MRVIRLLKPKVQGDFAKVLPNAEHYDEVVEGDVRVEGPNGEHILTIVRGKFSKEMLAKAWSVIKHVNLRTDNRGTASGLDMEAVKKNDGTESKTRAAPKGEEVISGVIGYYPRYPRIPFCRQCAWNAEFPAEFESLMPLFRQVNDLHKKYARESWDAQMKVVKKASKDFVIQGTAYTTVTVNKNFRTAMHLDAKNFAEGMAPMLLMRQGRFEGGLVVLPEWRIAAKLDTGDLIFFRNMKDYHGNTKIVPLTKDYQRCTMVFYFRDDMLKCGTMAQELERAKSGADYSKDFRGENENGAE